MLVLAQAGYFDDDQFVAYLEYLLYLRRPEYASYLTYLVVGGGEREPRLLLTRLVYCSFHRYPNGLIMLDLLQDAQFRRQLKDPACIAYIHRQQFYLWLNNSHRSELTTAGKVGTGERLDGGDAQGDGAP